MSWRPAPKQLQGLGAGFLSALWVRGCSSPHELDLWLFGRMRSPAPMWVGPMKASASLLQGSGEELHRPLPLPTLAQLPPSQALQRRPTGPNLWQSCLGSHKTSNQKTSIKQPPPQTTSSLLLGGLTRNFHLDPRLPSTCMRLHMQGMPPGL